MGVDRYAILLLYFTLLTCLLVIPKPFGQPILAPLSCNHHMHGRTTKAATDSVGGQHHRLRLAAIASVAAVASLRLTLILPTAARTRSHQHVR